MKVFVNVIASIVFVVQFISFFLNVLNQEEVKNTIESMYHYFYITAYLCSLFTVVFFILVYNFTPKSLHQKVTNYIIIVVSILGLYIPILQLFELNDFVLTSFILLIFDSYTILKVLNNLLPKSNENRMYNIGD